MVGGLGLSQDKRNKKQNKTTGVVGGLGVTQDKGGRQGGLKGVGGQGRGEGGGQDSGEVGGQGSGEGGGLSRQDRCVFRGWACEKVAMYGDPENGERESARARARERERERGERICVCFPLGVGCGCGYVPLRIGILVWFSGILDSIGWSSGTLVQLTNK